MNDISHFITFLMKAQVQFKVCHWQTKKHSRHVAFEDIYNDLDEQLDDMVECFMGKYGRIKFNGENCTLEFKNITDLNLTEMLSEIQSGLVSLETVVNENDKDILAIRDNILVSVNKLAYLLTFN